MLFSVALILIAFIACLRILIFPIFLPWIIGIIAAVPVANSASITIFLTVIVATVLFFRRP